MECNFLNKRINILTENADGELYMLAVDDYNEIVNDWMGDANYVPANDAKVFFASVCGEPVNPYAYTDFLSCAQYIRDAFVDKDKYKNYSVDDKTPTGSAAIKTPFSVNDKATFFFGDELMINDDREGLNGYLLAVDVLVDKLPSDKSMENINFYADYNVVTGAVKVIATYDTVAKNGVLNKELEVSLTEQEKAELLDTMQSYCKAQYFQTCLEFVNEARKEEGLEIIAAQRQSLTEQIGSAKEIKDNQIKTPNPHEDFSR